MIDVFGGLSEFHPIPITSGNEITEVETECLDTVPTHPLQGKGGTHNDITKSGN